MSLVKDKSMNHIKQYLEKRGNIPVDVRHEEELQKKGIDLLNLKLKNDEIHVTTFCVIGEESSSKHYFVKGMPEVDFVFYYYLEGKELNIINAKEFKEWFRRNEHILEVEEGYEKKNGEFVQVLNKKVIKKELMNATDIKTVYLDYYVDKEQMGLGI